MVSVMAESVDLSADYIDIREVIERFEELEDLTVSDEDRALLTGTYEEGDLTLEDVEDDDLGRLSQVDMYTPDFKEASIQEEASEYTELKELLGDLSGSGGDEQWRGNWYPITLIQDSAFEDHARELAADVGAIADDVKWPCNCIDWERAADELKVDYTACDINGETYYYR